MGYQAGITAQHPGLGEVGFELQELGIGILKQQFILFVPLFACSHHGQRRDITRLSNGGLPTDGVQQVCRTGVSVGIAHLWDEIVFHRTLQVWIHLHDTVEGFRVAVHKLILHRQWRELMATLCRGLPTVSPLARCHMHLIVFRTIDDIGRGLGNGRGCRIEKTTTDDAPLTVTTDTVATHERCYDAGELHRSIGTILIIAHVRALCGRPIV